MTWHNQKERSDPFWIHLIIRITKTLGRGVSGLLLYPISLYFLLINNRRTASSERYFERVLGRKATLADHYRQYLAFSRSLLDRMAVLLGDDAAITVTLEGLEHLEALRDTGHGGLLVGSHLGNFDILRMIGRTRGGYRVKAVMFGETTPTILEVFQSLNPTLHEDLLTIPGPSALMTFASDIREGLLIGLLGDRILPGERTQLCPFFGELAPFPTTPAHIADILEIPVLQFFCLQKGLGRYHVIFVPLADAMGGDRAGRSERIESLTRRYVENLESHARQAPYNWFNFHDVWTESL